MSSPIAIHRRRNIPITAAPSRTYRRTAILTHREPCSLASSSRCVCVCMCVCVRVCVCARPPSSVCPCTILSSLPAGVCATCRASLDSCQNARAHSNCNRARSRIRMVVCCKAVAGGAGWLEALTVEVAAVFMNRIPVCRRAWATNPTRSLVLALLETRHRACMGSTAGVDFPLEAIQVTAFSQGQGRAASLSSHLAHFA